MYTEATLDFPEEDIEFLRAGDVVAKLAGIRADARGVLARAKTGALLREGLTVVLVGRPNVGKSSLLNALAREEAAIVTPVAGTTRDTVERRVEIAGIPLTVVDTAGLRDTDDPVETIGIERTWAAVERADLVLLAGRRARARGRARRGGPDDPRAAAGRAYARVVVHNKADLARIAPAAAIRDERGRRRAATSGCPPMSAPASTCSNAKCSPKSAPRPRPRTRFSPANVTCRHCALASTHLADAAAQVALDPPPVELFAEELREAQAALSAITGEFTADDLLGVIFGRFCIGK